MVVTIGTYAVCNGTLTGGVAVGKARYAIDRLFEVVVPVGAVSPRMFDRVGRKTTFTFTVQVAHSSATAAESFVADLDTNLPSAGTVKLTLSDGSTIRYIPQGAVTLHSSEVVGSLSTTTYTIVGGPIGTSDGDPTPPPPPPTGQPWRLVTIVGPPAGVELQVLNSSNVWETVWNYTASS